MTSGSSSGTREPAEDRPAGQRAIYGAGVRELWPVPTDDLDIAERLGGDDRNAPPGRPWVTMVMISSLDGAIALDGVSGGLGGPADHARFVAARRLMDGIVVGASTVTAEDYQPASVPIAVITGSLSPDPGARLFSDPERPPLLYTTSEAAAQRGARFDGVAEVIDLGESIEPTAVLADLASRGLSTVALEGGPTLNGQMLAADVVDEILLSISPLALGGHGSRLARGPAIADGARFGVDRVLLADDLLFVRYLRRR